MDMMIDLIERRKAAEILCKAICGNERGLCVSTPKNCWQSKMVELYKLETVNAVPVVRCKNCIHKEKAVINRKGYLICPASGMEITDKDFCSYGKERKE